VKSNQIVINILLVSAILAGFYFIITFAFDDVKLGPYMSLVGLVSLVANIILVKKGVIEPPAHLGRDYVADPFTRLTFIDSTLVIGGYEIHKNKIKKVVLDSVQPIDSPQYQGLVQLPFNQQKGQIPELWFDPIHLQSVRDYINKQIPEVTFVK
jgi:hypothetical protein